MLELYNNVLCISATELINMGVISRHSYDKMASRGKIDVVRSGGGRGNYVLVAVGSLPAELKQAVVERYPNHDTILLQEWLRSNYEVDQQAMAYFMNKGECGVELPQKAIAEYVSNASVLNACIRLYNSTKAIRKTMGMSYDWAQMARVVEYFRLEFGHTLPASMARFRKRVNEYRDGGYGVLISGKWGNQAARKVDYKTERLLLSLACLPNKPYNSNVWEMYNAFICLELDVYDKDTGELLNPDDYCDSEGNPIELSESTVSNYLNKPKNKLLIAKALDSYNTYYHEQMPHMHRHAPEWSLSKISLDDRDLPRKLRDTKSRPKAYYAYDVASGAVIGYAYNRNKNADLVIDCFRSMFRLLDKQGWGCPAQVEVENHLMSRWRDNFLKAGEMFPFVRFCAPQNSQEKYAEALNGAKKRKIEHKNHIGIGRFYGKGKWRTESQKVYNELNDTYMDSEYYTWEQLIAEDVADIEEYNHSLHPNQKRYTGMTRWQVLEANINPTLQPIAREKLVRYIGECVKTSIRRNSYCRVAQSDWWLSSPSVLERLAPNNYEVDAYYIPKEDGMPAEVYVYQNDRMIDRLEAIGTYNTAEAERTANDWRTFAHQQAKVREFKEYVAEREVATVGIMNAVPVAQKSPLRNTAVVEEVVEDAISYIPHTTIGGSKERALADL